jgi:hypothetical protein
VAAGVEDDKRNVEAVLVRLQQVIHVECSRNIKVKSDLSTIQEEDIISQIKSTIKDILCKSFTNFHSWNDTQQKFNRFILEKYNFIDNLTMRRCQNLSLNYWWQIFKNHIP